MICGALIRDSCIQYVSDPIEVMIIETRDDGKVYRLCGFATEDA